MKKVVLGIDIGGTNTVYGFVDQDGNIVHSDEIPTHGNKPVDNFINRLGEKLDSFLTDNSDFKLCGIGVGAPNGNHFTGIIQDPPNLSWGDV
ncbi:MAG TPA: ROK family protein, partial [Candidatus Marinimicrobia bacterium]|nr:ROK family protein [Candidatus Neomarinimicrobiota bacterium]